MTTNPSSICPQCGAAIPEQAGHGLCPKCVFEKAMLPTAGPSVIAPALEEVQAAFPHLEVLGLIGSGGMGSVFKARQPQLDRFVALKILSQELADQPGFSERFQREARALARLNHPHIVTVHDFGQAGPFYYLLMEHVDGVNLRQLLMSKRLTPKEALSIVPPICEALQCAHDHGIVHRDIKPENLLMDKAGIVKIADFGIAKMHGGPLEDAALGTPDYAAPEQAEGEADHRADIYSLGVVLYEMLTGERPQKNIEPPSRRVQVDVGIDEIVLRALEQKPEHRFATATEFRTQVEAATQPKSLSGVQRFFQKWLPEPWFQAMEQESKCWKLRCGTCGSGSSVWARGGIRFGAAGNPKKAMWCKSCASLRVHRIEWAGPGEMPKPPSPGVIIAMVLVSVVLGWLGIFSLVSALIGISAVGSLITGGLFVLGVSPLVWAIVHGGWVRAFSRSAFALALPFLAFTAFFGYSMAMESGGWHPSASEAVIVPLAIAAAALLLFLAFVLARASTRKSGLGFLGRALAVIVILVVPAAMYFSEMATQKRQSVAVQQRSVLKQVRARLMDFHKRQPSNTTVVKVVYFHPKDREPLTDFAPRLDRVLADVSEFYRQELDRHGFETEGIPFERSSIGQYKIHLVRGQHPGSHYTYASGHETWAEIQQALAGQIDPEKDHVLVLYGLCHQARDGRYVFHSPYYGAGWSDHRHGLCHAADCELLDPELLTAKDRPMVFSEHYYARQEMSVAQFNSWYLGGIAHELGHSLGLPHDAGGPDEQHQGTSLMGSGNLHYRSDRHGGKKPAFLSLASALRLAAHPLVTRSDKDRWSPVTLGASSIRATPGEDGTLQLSGTVQTSVPACAMIISLWDAKSAPGQDHAASTFCAAVDRQGKFELTITPPNTGDWKMKIGAVLMNGAEPTITTTLRVDADQHVDIDALNLKLSVQLVESLLMQDPALAAPFLDDVAIARVELPEARRQLKLLQQMTLPEPPLIDLTSTEEPQVYVSDAHWTHAEVGWGKVMRNRYDFSPEQLQGMLLQLNGRVFAKGLYAHAKSNYTFQLAGRWKRFETTVGLRDGNPAQGRVVFIVEGDGQELARSGFLDSGAEEKLSADVSNVRTLSLRVEGPDGHNHGCWSIWCDPLLTR